MLELKEYIKQPNKAKIRYTFPAATTHLWENQSRTFSYSGDLFLSEESKLLIVLIVLWKINSVAISRSQEDQVTFLEFDFDPINTFSLDYNSIDLLFKQEPGTVDSLWKKANAARKTSARKGNLSVEIGPYEEAKKEEAQVSGLLFYELTETAHALLHAAAAAYSRMSVKESNKNTPDELLLKEIGENKKLARDILSRAENFSSLAQLQAIVEKYSPIVKALYSSNTKAS